MRPYETIKPLPLLVSDSVALCTKVVTGATGWLLNE